VVRTGALVLALLALPACSADEPAAAARASDQPAAASTADDRVRGVLDGVALRLEVADTEQERATGLMGRESVPPGTGMVFRYDEPSTGRYWMFDVSIPLRATFVRDGTVVTSVVMPPCESDDPASCPTYGADGPYDTVVETAPDAVPDVAPGDAFTLDD
jgi:uncharacterized membrane protein (UPF0127 family)